ncbi:MAG: glutamate-1-semialdehyde 2,1-aminomutase [Proteobacteria bacterium]|nr:glutamate-1-semialdehyde 2,1-aminomutase [Pseudomonadota bacterium]
MERGRLRIPGGVNSPVRAFGSVGGHARFIREAHGAHVTDEDGRRYIDYVASWGAILCGHAHPEIVEAVSAAARRGTSFGAPTAAEVELAEGVAERVPACEMLRLVNSGTEATMSALRLARAATGRARLIKFDGCYHGHADALLASAGSGVATLGLPGTQGVPAGAVGDTIVVAYNDLAAVETAFERYPGEIAAVIVEPIAANMGLVAPVEGFLEGLRALCDRHSGLLIFDEVICGFRVGPGGAQGRLGVTPDLSAFGKVIGGGLPIGAYGGRRELMEQVAPCGGVYQAGTLSGNPLATAAGLKVLELIGRGEVFAGLDRISRRLAEGMIEAGKRAGVPLVAQSFGGLWGYSFRSETARDYAGAAAADHERYAAFFHAMLEEGVYFAPSGYEAAFVTTAHTDAEVDQTLEAARRALERMD